MCKLSFLRKSMEYILVLVPLCIALPAGAQTISSNLESHLYHTLADATDPPGTIDGSVTPNLIPDDLAYRMFFTAVAESSRATALQKTRQQAKLRPIGLSQTDIGALSSALATYYDRVAPLASATAATTSDSTLAAARALQAALVKALSLEGQSQLDAHIQKEKRHMKIYPAPAMQ